MEYSQLYVFVLLIHDFLHILLPLASMTAFFLLRLGFRLLGPKAQGENDGDLNHFPSAQFKPLFHSLGKDSGGLA